MADDYNEQQKRYVGSGISIGVAVGVAVGLAIGNLAIGIGPGIAIGVAFGMFMAKKHAPKPGTENPEDESGRT